MKIKILHFAAELHFVWMEEHINPKKIDLKFMKKIILHMNTDKMFKNNLKPKINYDQWAIQWEEWTTVKLQMIIKTKEYKKEKVQWVLGDRHLCLFIPILFWIG